MLIDKVIQISLSGLHYFKLRFLFGYGAQGHTFKVKLLSYIYTSELSQYN